ncbi:MAG TPA: hypothetical protein VH234_04690 [Candidatus Saccharimonadales bacterium]|jgi:hypothetical protein|nr:hypothetical protein [Candidatus Saccharimonadales bacterium]
MKLPEGSKLHLVQEADASLPRKGRLGSRALQLVKQILYDSNPSASSREKSLQRANRKTMQEALSFNGLWMKVLEQGGRNFDEKSRVSSRLGEDTVMIVGSTFKKKPESPGQTTKVLDWCFSRPEKHDLHVRLTLSNSLEHDDSGQFATPTMTPSLSVFTNHQGIRNDARLLGAREKVEMYDGATKLMQAVQSAYNTGRVKLLPPLSEATA